MSAFLYSTNPDLQNLENSLQNPLLPYQASLLKESTTCSHQLGSLTALSIKHIKQKNNSTLHLVRPDKDYIP